jgi:regulation of enolase protein 1 (concanavalin A-like superfamily)
LFEEEEKIMQWYNEPMTWTVIDKTIIITADPKTDFWRKTHYGFIRDNGHCYYQSLSGDFTAEVKVSGEYATLYDQAGLMLRLDEANWLKCGIEFVNGRQYVSAVVTRDYSDWSVVPLPQNPASLWLRLKRSGTTVEVEYSLDGETYAMLRVTYLPQADIAHVGPMCAAPEGEGFTARFEQFNIHT